MARDPDALASGATVGPLTVGELLVRTPEAFVYRARHGSLGEVLLQEYWPRGLVGRGLSGGVELVNPAWRDDFRGAVGRFQDRAEQLAELPERSRPRVLELLGANGTAYAVMGAIGGQTLAAALDAGRFRTSAELKQLDGMLADTLGDWHWKGVFHGDLTPETLLVTPGDEPRLVPIGFGAAKDLQLRLTRSPEAVSTPGYTAFEQYDLRGEDPPGPAADLYAAGAILYRAVTGAPPQEPDRRLVRSRHKTLAELAPAGLDGSFKLRVDRALEPLSENRPQTVYDWRSLSAEPTVVAPPETDAEPPVAPAAEQKTKRPAKPPPVRIAPAVIPPPPTFSQEGSEPEPEPEHPALFTTPAAEPVVETNPPPPPEPEKPLPEPEPIASAPLSEVKAPPPRPAARPVNTDRPAKTRRPSRFPWVAVFVVGLLGAAVAGGAYGLRYLAPKLAQDTLKTGAGDPGGDLAPPVAEDKTKPPEVIEEAKVTDQENTAGGGPPPLGSDGSGAEEGTIALAPANEEEPVWNPVPENDREPEGATTIKRAEEPKSKPKAQAKAERPPVTKPKTERAKVCRQVCTEGDRIPVYGPSGGGMFSLSMSNFAYSLSQSGSAGRLAEERAARMCRDNGGALRGVTRGRADCDPVAERCFVSLNISCARPGGRSIIRYDRGPRSCKQVCQ